MKIYLGKKNEREFVFGLYKIRTLKMPKKHDLCVMFFVFRETKPMKINGENLLLTNVSKNK
jgi:hypothetical protein